MHSFMQLWFVNLMQPVFFSLEYYRLLDEINVFSSRFSWIT